MRITKNIVPFIDVLFTFLMVFVCITFLLKAKSDTESASYQQENALYLIILNWEGNSDLDLWGKDPLGNIVSFSRREGGQGCLFSLNRDNQGAHSTEIGQDGNPIFKINEEIITIRGAVVGEYIFNVHSFNVRDSKVPIKATVKLVKNKPYKVVTIKEKEYYSNGEEQTFFRFSLDSNGTVTDINELPSSIIQSGNPNEQGATNPDEPIHE